MKCHNHRDTEAVGACSKCGRNVCAKCSRAIQRQIICNECIKTEQKTYFRLKTSKLPCALLGWLGALNTLLTGTYITTTYLNLTIISPRESLHAHAYAIGLTTAILTMMLTYGSYLQLKRHGYLGAEINIIAGALFLAIFVYFRWLSQPPFLAWLGLMGYFLPAPALLSGIIDILLREKQSQQAQRLWKHC